LSGTVEKDARFWNDLFEPYSHPQLGKSLYQLLNTATLVIVGWYVMLRCVDHLYWLTLLLAVPMAGLFMRLFIIQHDCGHGSFFRSRAANDTLGSMIGVFLLTPYHYWRRTHAMHHASSGDLDRRELGDIVTRTVNEYRAMSRWERFGYRVYRSPFVLFGVGPIYQFMIKHRLPLDAPKKWKKEWAGILATDAALAGVVFAMAELVGLRKFLLVQLPISVIAGSLGVFLFYIQHQFEDTHWREHIKWNFHTAAFWGSSLYELPPVLRWFSGNIGFHHVHHLASKISNYRLRRCLAENPPLQQANRLTLPQSLSCMSLKLWDEEHHKLVGFRSISARQA
jgi:omega-6 fatty acid desaturase (delta-12 desaturase)